ncbi:hypothetical protein IL38_06540 [Actinopolyspora erythraea]|uniref:Uncharacterized protein n=1 Tax=Actinopolyspora erythraea TaxID=414996 RepID=A0ABR4X6T3_9ACTN|nr:hypothetical protein IL38_06540 [Actinopolyspora erythraea]
MAVPCPAGAIIGRSRGTSSTAAVTTVSTSLGVREKNSPVPPAANSPAAPYPPSHRMFSR